MKLVDRAMTQNFSWEKAAERYERIYTGLARTSEPEMRGPPPKTFVAPLELVTQQLRRPAGLGRP
jgi:hypothetical protein